MLLYILDLLGVAVFAGMLARLDLFGVLVLASSGGTIRDVLLGHYPVFWGKDSGPLLAILAATALTVVWVQYLPVPRDPLVVALMGTLTGAGGGVVRDVFSAKVPLILQRDIYATAAIAGILLYLVLRALRVPTAVAFVAGVVTVAATRLASIAYDLQLPVVGVGFRE